jgi:hypothetical protein
MLFILPLINLIVFSFLYDLNKIEKAGGCFAAHNITDLTTVLSDGYGRKEISGQVTYL